MSRIVFLMDEILKQGRDKYGSDFKTYEKSGGRFTLKEVKRIGAKADAMLISCLNFADITQTGCHEYPLKMVMHIVCTGKGREIEAIRKTESVVGWLQDNQWDMDLDPAEKIVATNLYNNEIDQLGVTIWGIGFEQIIRLG